MPIIYDPHACGKPAANKYTASYGPDPAYVHGTIWQCDDCGRHWWAGRVGGMGVWYPVRFWNLCLKHHIRKATQ